MSIETKPLGWRARRREARASVQFERFEQQFERFEQTGDAAHLRKAIEHLRIAIQSTTRHSPEWVTSQLRLCQLRLLGEQNGCDDTAPEEVLRFIEDELTSVIRQRGDSDEGGHYLHVIGWAHSRLWYQTTEVQHLRRAIAAYRLALLLLHRSGRADHRDLALYEDDLAMSYNQLAMEYGSASLSRRALDHNQRALDLLDLPRDVRVYAQIYVTRPAIETRAYHVTGSEDYLKRALLDARNAIEACRRYAPGLEAKAIQHWVDAKVAAFELFGSEELRTDALIGLARLGANSIPDYDEAWQMSVAARLFAYGPGYPVVQTRPIPEDVLRSAKTMQDFIERQRLGPGGGITFTGPETIGRILETLETEGLAGIEELLDREGQTLPGGGVTIIPPRLSDDAPSIIMPTVDQQVQFALEQLTNLERGLSIISRELSVPKSARAGRFLLEAKLQLLEALAACAERVPSRTSQARAFLDEAIGCADDALALQPRNSELAGIEITRHRLKRRAGHYADTDVVSSEIQRLKSKALFGHGDPGLTLSAACEWAQTSEAQGASTDACRAYIVALSAMARLLGSSRDRYAREAIARRVPTMVNSAACAFAGAGRGWIAARALDRFRAVSATSSKLAPELSSGKTVRDPPHESAQLRRRRRGSDRGRESRVLPAVISEKALVSLAQRHGPIVYLTHTDTTGYAIIVLASGSLEILPLEGFTTTPLIDAVQRFSTDLESWARRQPTSSTRDTIDAEDRQLAEIVGSARQWTWRTVMHPLVQALSGHTTCVLVGGGWLSNLPFHSAGEEQHSVLDSMAVRYVPNSSFLWNGHAGSSRNFVGYSHFTDRDSKKELRRIAANFTEPKLLYKDDCAGLLQKLADADAIHIVTHGRSDIYDARRSSVDVGLAPLYVRDLEAFGALKSNPLVTLAACWTATSGVYASDEHVGFPIAWLQAGAGALIAPQWPVKIGEAATASFLFYRNWQAQGMLPWDAWRQAMLELRDRTQASGGLEWASFSFWG